MNKRIGFFKGLKETWGFRPYFYLLMLELFSWLSLQVRITILFWLDHVSFFSDAVYPGEFGSVHQVLPGTGEPIPLLDSSTSSQLHHLHANVAACHPQVWQEDHILCGHVDTPAFADLHAFPRPLSLPILSLEFLRGNGCVLCLPRTMVTLHYTERP